MKIVSRRKFIKGALAIIATLPVAKMVDPILAQQQDVILTVDKDGNATIKGTTITVDEKGNATVT